MPERLSRAARSPMAFTSTGVPSRATASEPRRGHRAAGANAHPLRFQNLLDPQKEFSVCAVLQQLNAGPHSLRILPVATALSDRLPEVLAQPLSGRAGQ